MLVPPPAPDFDRRWDLLLDMISVERGWSEPHHREFPDAEDESNCWAMPAIPVEGLIPGSVHEETLCGDVVIIDATWTFDGERESVPAHARSAAGWLPAVHVVEGRIQNLREEVFLPMTTLGDGDLPAPATPEESLEGGIPLMKEYEELLARSALAGAHVPAWLDDPISTAATEVSDGAHACSELASVPDLPVLEPFAQQELRSALCIRRSYVWFFARSAEEETPQIPGSVRWDHLERSLAYLRIPRSRRDITEIPLRSYALFDDAVSAAELDGPHHRFSEKWRSAETSDDILPYIATDASTRQGATMNQDWHDAVNVAQLFTRAIEKAMEAGKLGTEGNSAERNRIRHEAVAQYLLDHILQQGDQLERLLEMLGVDIDHDPVLYAEWPDPETGSRFDHVVDDTTEESYRSVLVIEDKLDAQLAPDQLDRYCTFLDDQDGPATLLVLHPARNPLSSEKNRIPQLMAEHADVTVVFMSWSDLSARMIAAAPDGPYVALWRALEEFAENVGTGDLEELPAADLLSDPAVAQEVQDVFCTIQKVAARVGSGRSRQLHFSLHGGNPEPWLQMALSNKKTNSVGLELDVMRDPGTLLIGGRGPDAPWGEYIAAKIGYFRDGKLSPAAVRRTEEIASLAVDVRDHGATFPRRLSGRSSGATVSEDAQDAIALVAAVFQAQAIKNPHRGGAPSRRTRGVNEGESNERLGAILVNDDGDEDRSIHLFIGPPAGQPWERCTIWIRDEDGEREIAVKAGESGRDYVLRVWSEARTALGARQG